MTIPPTPAQGVRLDWTDVPEHLRHAFEAWAGARVVSGQTQPSGFSPGVAARLTLADKRSVFVKAVGPTPNPDSPSFHRREARIVASLPEGLPVPRLRWALDDTDSGWVVLVFDAVTGAHPAQPWRFDELERVVGGLAQLASGLTPSPLLGTQVPSAGDRLADRICGWRRLLESSPEERTGLDDWSARNLSALAELEARAPSAVQGETLLHFDVRADNVLLAPDKVWFFDWPHACVGVAWLDVVAFAPSVTMQGGPQPEHVVMLHPAYRSADPSDVTAALAAIAGFFIRDSLQPAPPGLPTLRVFQAAQGRVAREWLARRTGWT
jgi:aminoglycoside phosphotransferase (APT) family kinase protein